MTVNVIAQVVMELDKRIALHNFAIGFKSVADIDKYVDWVGVGRIHGLADMLGKEPVILGDAQWLFHYHLFLTYGAWNGVPLERRPRREKREGGGREGEM